MGKLVSRYPVTKRYKKAIELTTPIVQGLVGEGL
jgi:hypothetical protein